MQELWRQGRGNKDKISHNVDLFPAKVNEKRRFFFAGSNLFSKRSHQKTKRILKKSKTSSFCWSAFGRMAFGAFLQKSDLVADWWLTWTFRYLLFLGICLSQAISVLRYQPWKSAENVEPSIYADGKKTPTNKSERSTEATKPKSCSFFFIGLYNLLG